MNIDYGYGYDPKKQSYRIYRLNADGSASWATNREATSAAEALLTGYRAIPDLVPEGSTFVVVPHNDNPSNKQVVFTLRAQASVEAVPTAI